MKYSFIDSFCCLDYWFPDPRSPILSAVAHYYSVFCRDYSNIWPCRLAIRPPPAPLLKRSSFLNRRPGQMMTNHPKRDQAPAAKAGSLLRAAPYVVKCCDGEGNKGLEGAPKGHTRLCSRRSCAVLHVHNPQPSNPLDRASQPPSHHSHAVFLQGCGVAALRGRLRGVQDPRAHHPLRVGRGHAGCRVGKTLRRTG
jgi:hypothetical protein